MFKRVSIILSFLFSCNLAFAQESGIKVYVIDKITKQPLPFAQVLCEVNSRQIAADLSDDEGYAKIKPLDTGKYNVKVIYIGYDTAIKACVTVLQDKLSMLTIGMMRDSNFMHGIVTTHMSNNIELIDKEDTIHQIIDVIPAPDNDCWSTGIFYREGISHLPSNNLNYVLDFFPLK